MAREAQRLWQDRMDAMTREQMADEIGRLRGALKACVARAGAPDPVEACRLVISTAEEALSR